MNTDTSATPKSTTVVQTPRMPRSASGQTRGDHAIVLGASMAGLLAARALADHYARVTLIERDAFPEAGESRKGVPQGRHPHGLLSRGRDILEEFFPGLTADLTAQGALLSDISRDSRFFLGGGYLCQPESNLMSLIVSRPLLENRVRAHLLALPNVRLIEGCDIGGLEADAVADRIVGVRARRRGMGDADELLLADLVVDATGRGSQLPAWLAALGYEPPAQERVEVRVGYASRLYRRPPAQPLDAIAVIGASTPAMPRSGVMAAIEGDRWIVGLTGYFGDYPPTDDEGFRAFAASLPIPEITAVVAGAEPLGAAVPYRFPASQRWRYERLTRFPEGLLVVGDAICSFNPVYGQGMSVAALEASALGACLEEGTDRLAQRFFARAARIISTPWSIAVGGDLLFPQVKGPRGPMVRFLNWYLGHLQRAARRDAEVAVAFQRVANLVAEPASLLRPRIAWLVLRKNLQSAPDAARTAATPHPAAS